MTKDEFMQMAWRDFLSWAYDTPEVREQFERETGHVLSLPPTSPLDRMIDEATGKNELDAFEFAKWATVTMWGLDEAPAAFRREVESQSLPNDLPNGGAR